jgi:two-component system sensor histidine kinase BaeS
MPEWRDGRPPWWPQDEPFPPEGGWGPWRGMRRRFVRRMLVGALVIVLVLSAIAAVVGTIVARMTSGNTEGPWHGGRFYPFGPLFLLGVVITLVLVVRAVRRRTAPVGEVMEGVGRVASGDLTARVEVRGSGDDRRLAGAFNRMVERLESDEARRRELLADLAHELRTPLAVIRGNVEAMLDGLYPVDPAHLRTVLDETDVLARLLEDLRTLSTAEAGALVLHREPVEVRALIDDALAAFGAQADERSVSLRPVVPDGLPAIDVDPVRITEVLANLLQNALRHTPAGGSVEVAATEDAVSSSASDVEGSRAIVVTVTDTGPGIPPELQPHVFDRFVRGPDSGGSGLGLAIAKSLVDAHGGSIRAENAPGGGTVVRLRLPIRRPA